MKLTALTLCAALGCWMGCASHHPRPQADLPSAKSNFGKGRESLRRFQTNPQVCHTFSKITFGNRATGSNGLSLWIIIPSTEVKPDGTLSAFLDLSNGSSQPIRTTTRCSPLPGVFPGGNFDVTWMPGFFMDDPPSPEQLLPSVQTLAPGQNVKLPFEIIVETNKTLHITAHYSAGGEQAKALGLWRGQVDAQPVTIRFISPHSRSADCEYQEIQRLDYPGLNDDSASFAYAFPWKKQLNLYEQAGWSVDSVCIVEREVPNGKPFQHALITLKRARK